MTPGEMEALIETHLRAGGNGDPEGGADDAVIIKNLFTATVTEQFLGIPRAGTQVRFRALHVFEFRGGGISRENCWLDGAGLATQLTS